MYWILSSISIAELGSIFNQLIEAPAHVSHMFKEEGEKAIAADHQAVFFSSSFINSTALCPKDESVIDMRAFIIPVIMFR